MKIAITGASGMLGRALVKELEANHEIFEIDKKTGTDITDQPKVNELIGDFRPDLIIHAAAWTDVDGCEDNPNEAQRVNVRGTENIVQAAKKVNSRLIYISTDYVFDGRQELKRPYKESDKPRPISVYGRTKLDGEKYIKNNLPDYLIIRTSWLFGPGGKNFVLSILNLAKKHRELKVVNDQFGTPTYAPDLAKAIKEIIDSLDGKEFRDLFYYRILHLTNDGSGEDHPQKDPSISWWKFAGEILEIKGIDIKLNPISSDKLNRLAPRPQNCKLMSLEPEKPKMRSWQEALKEYLTEVT